jgi:hypothetical protein
LSPLPTLSLGRLFADYDDSFPDVASLFEVDAPENVQDPETPSMERDTKLLGFSPPLQRHTLLNSTNQKIAVSLSAQLHGMFFLAESPWVSTSDVRPLSNELTCYRRNLFEITGEIAFPSSLRNVTTDQGNRSEIVGQELVISATESFHGNSVELISVPWKTPADQSQTRCEDNLDRKPPSIPLRSMHAEESDSEVTKIPFHWKRLQFRNATANNGRRKELQQHFVVRIKVLACLADGSKITICEVQSGGVTVRGRNPRNFQARNDRPLHEQNKRASHALSVSFTGESTKKHGNNGSITSMPDLHAKTPGQGLQLELQSPVEPLDSFLKNDLFDWFAMSNLYPGPSTVLPLTESPPEATNASANINSQSRSNDRINLLSCQPSSRYHANSAELHEDPPSALEPLSLPDISPPAPSTAKTPTNVLSSHLANARKKSSAPRYQSRDSDSSDEDTELLYEYFPLGLDDWLPPIDAVYRPHAVHHTDPSTDPRNPASEGKTDMGRNKRYFSRLAT